MKMIFQFEYPGGDNMNGKESGGESGLLKAIEPSD